MLGSITWIYGNSGAGKTTLAQKIADVGTIILDGDALRTCWQLGFSKEDRWEQNMRIAKISMILASQGFEVIVATICPYRKLRADITKLCHPRWILVEGGKKPSKEYPFER